VKVTLTALHTFNSKLVTFKRKGLPKVIMSKKDRQSTYNVTLRQVCDTTAAMKKQ
jgi:hypothetical protein